MGEHDVATADPQRRALIVGATGIAGAALARPLRARSWTVFGLSCRAPSAIPGVRPVLADLTDPNAVSSALRDVQPTHVFLTAWSRQATEAANIDINAAVVRNVLAAASSVQRC